MLLDHAMSLCFGLIGLNSDCQLERKALQRAAAVHILESIPGITPGDGSLLLDCFGSVLRVMHCSYTEVLEHSPCTKQTARAVHALFSEASPSVFRQQLDRGSSDSPRRHRQSNDDDMRLAPMPEIDPPSHSWSGRGRSSPGLSPVHFHGYPQ